MSNQLPQNLNFNVKISQFGPNSFFAEVDSPAGKAEGKFALPFDTSVLQTTLDSYRQNIRKTRDASATNISDIFFGDILAPEELGGKLFDTVFQNGIKECYLMSRRQSWRERRPLLFKFEIEPGADQLINLPWEYLYDPNQGKKGEFFAFNADTPIIRHWPGQEPRPFDPVSPLRVLIVSARPKGDEAGLANLQREAKAIRNQLYILNRDGKNIIEVFHLEAANLTELGDYVRDPDTTPHMIHFIGHGNVGSLLFEEEHTGQGSLASEDTLMIMLRNAPNLRMVVLNSCRTARANRLSDQLGVAQCLADTGIPAVLAMQFAISDDAAEVFSSEFYKVISEGRSVDRAVTWGRIKIQQKFPSDQAREWGTPVLYLQTDDGDIFSDLIQRKTPASTKKITTPGYTEAGPGFAEPGYSAPDPAGISSETRGEIIDTEQARQQADEVAQLVAHYRSVLKTHYNNLHKLKEQESNFGIEVPLAILNGIKKEEEEIGKIEAQLKKLIPEEAEVMEGETTHSGYTRPFKSSSAKLDTDSVKRISPSIRDQVTQMYDQGNRALENKDWGEAVKLLSRAQKLSSDLPHIDQLVVKARQEWQQTSEGRSQYLTMKAQYELAKTHIGQQDWEDAAMLLEPIVNVDAGYVDAYQLSVETRENANKQKMEEEKQNQLINLYQQAQFALNDQNWAEAVDNLNKIAEIDPDYQAGKAADLLKQATRQRDMLEAYSQGKLHYDKGEWIKAVALLGKVFSMDEDDQYPDVKNLLEKSRRQKQLDAWIKEAEDYIGQGSWEEAIKILQENEIATDRVDGELALNYALAHQYRQAHAWDQAAERLQKIIQTRSNYRSDVQDLYDEADQQAELARLYQEAIGQINDENWELAKTRLEQIVAAEPDNSRAQKRLAQVNEEILLSHNYYKAKKLMEHKQWNEAIPLWQEVLEIRSQGYLDASEKLEKAQEQLELNTFYKHGVDAAGKGDWDAAQIAFIKVAQRAPDFRDVQTQLENAQNKISLIEAYTQGVETLYEGKAAFDLQKLKTAFDLLGRAYDIDLRYLDVSNRFMEASRELELLQLYIDGQSAFDHKKWDMAIKHLEKLVKSQPDYHGDATQKLAEAERLAELDQKYQEARTATVAKDWEQVIILLKQVAGDPEFPGAADELAEANIQLELAIALNEARNAMEAEKWAEAIDKCVFIQQKRDTYKKDEVKELHQKAEQNLLLETTFAQGLQAAKDKIWQTACHRFEKVYNTNPDYRDVETRMLQAQQQQTLNEHYEAGKAAAQEKDWETAIGRFIKIQSIDPDYQDAEEYLAKAQKQQQLALDYNIAMKKFEAGKWVEANELFGQILAEESDYEDVQAKQVETEKQIQMAQLYEQAQDAIPKALWAEAVSSLEEISNIDPDYRDVTDQLQIAQKQKTLDELYKRAGVLREIENEWPEALGLLVQVIELDPDYKEAITWKYDLEDKIHKARVDQLYHQAEGILDTEDESRWDAGIQRLKELLTDEPDHEQAKALLTQAQQRRETRVQTLQQQVAQAKIQKKWSDVMSPLARLIALDPQSESLKTELTEISQAYTQQKRNRLILGVMGIVAILFLTCVLGAIFSGGFSLIFGDPTPIGEGQEQAQHAPLTNDTETSSEPGTMPNEPSESETDTSSSKGDTSSTGPIIAEDASESAIVENSVPDPQEDSPESIKPEEESTIETGSEIMKPDPVTRLQFDNLSDSSVSINWSIPSGTYTGFILQRDGTSIVELRVGTQSHTIYNLSCGSSYTFNLIVVNDTKFSEPTQVSVTTLDCPQEETEPASPSVSSPTGKIAVPVFNNQTSSYDIYVASAGNGWDPVLSFEGASQPDFSPDGQKLLVRSWGRNRYGISQKLIIYNFNLETLKFIESPGNIREMTHNVEDAHPSWRPGNFDGDILFHSDRGTGYVDLFFLATSPSMEDSPENQLNLGTGENPDWLGTKKIVYFSRQGGDGIWVADENGANRQLVYEHTNSLSPAGGLDGDSIAVSLPTGGDWWNIYRFSAAQGAASQVQLTNGNYHDWLPTWSPDGNHVAFISDRDKVGEEWAVWVVPVNEENPVPIRLFGLPGSSQGIVAHAQDVSHGWGEERISWGR